MYQSNELVQSNYGATLNEKRIISCAIAALKKQDFYTNSVTIYVGHFKKIFNLTGGSIFENLEHAVSNLVEAKPVHVKLGRGDWKKYNWFTSVEYIKTEGYFTLNFNPELFPFLQDITGYVSYHLSEISNYRTAAAIRVFELVKHREKLGSFEMSVEELRQRLGATESYAETTDFLTKIVKPAIKQVNKHSTVFVELEALRSGRRITHLIFKILNEKQVAKIKGRAEIKKMLDAVR